jgi:hypothetical protein
MKRSIALIMMLLMLPQLVLANHTTHLKAILDDYTYSMEVVWDQKDQNFAHKIQQNFISELQLLLEQGLTKEDIIKASGISLDQMAKEIEYKQIKNAQEISLFLLEHREFKKGASWVGDVILASVFFTPIIVMIGLMIHGSLTREERLNRINSCLESNPINQDHCFDLI